jgi:hypothetical protein
MNKFYTGVGSREITSEEFNLIRSISNFLSGKFCLRSGKALGSDTAFEVGVSESPFPNNKEIYIPWRNFKGNEIKGECLVLSTLGKENETLEYERSYIQPLINCLKVP